MCSFYPAHVLGLCQIFLRDPYQSSNVPVVPGLRIAYRGQIFQGVLPKSRYQKGTIVLLYDNSMENDGGAAIRYRA
jgi:hypothetical protein